MSRDQLLDAAATVVLTDGADTMTISTVAERAGMSRGGLLYHFPSKQALIEGLVRRMIDQYDAVLAVPSKRPGDALRAYLDECVPVAYSAGPSATDRLTAALLAAVASEPTTLEPLRERYEAWQSRLAHDGVDPTVATVVRLAVDGWWLARLFDLAPPADDAHTGVRAALHRLIDDAPRVE